MSIRPWIRRYNYIQDYFQTTYDIYIREYPAYPVTYYAFDKDNSVGDFDLTEMGSYEKLGVGKLSGYLWKKIYILPVFGIEAMQPTQETGESGMHYRPNLISALQIPDSYGFKPTAGIDMVDLDFGFLNPAIKQKALFNVTKVDIAHHGDFHQLYRCGLSIAPVDRNEIEEQVSSIWMFYEFTKKIVPYDAGKMMTYITNKVQGCSDEINSMYQHSCGFYLRSSEI